MEDDRDWIFTAAQMDVRYWRLLHSEFCPNCKVPWNAIPAEANVIPHWHGDCKAVVEELRQKARAEIERQDEMFLRELGIVG